MRNVFSSDVDNLVPPRNVYQGTPGATVGTRASAATPYTSGGADSPAGMAGPSNTGAGNAVTSPVQGNPLMWWGVLVIVLLALMWLSKRVGSQGENFSNVRVSAWNVLIVTLAAVIGINALKALTAYVNVPGLTPLVHAT